MGSSDKEVRDQNLETASAVQTDYVTGSHFFTVCRYSLTKGIGVGNCISSDVFSIGGSDWIIKYYPDGYYNQEENFIAFRLDHNSKAPDVKAQFSFTILQQDGVPSDLGFTSEVKTFKGPGSSWTYWQSAKRTDFEAAGCLKDDSFTMKCTVTVIKGHHLKTISRHCGVSIPPSNLMQNLADLLESGKGSDVTFLVKGDKFNAHRYILAARSAVFSAELLGSMKETWTDTITVDDIEPPVFKSMLYFIYVDALPDFERTSVDNGENQDMRLMAQHLLVAADRYQLERLRLICQNILSKNLCVDNTVTTLLLAERHNCSELKAQCLIFMSSPEIFKAVALTDEFPNLMKICPSILKDI